MLSQRQGRTSPIGDKFRQRAAPAPFLTRFLGGHPHDMLVLLKGLTDGSAVVTDPHHFLSLGPEHLCLDLICADGKYMGSHL